MGKRKAELFALPSWIDSTVWDEFVAMRQKLRRPMTDYAKHLVVLELQRLVAQGMDSTAILNQSIRNGWQDVYELRDKRGDHEQRAEHDREIPPNRVTCARCGNSRPDFGLRYCPDCHAEYARSPSAAPNPARA